MGITKEILEVKLMTAAMGAVNDQLEALIEDCKMTLGECLTDGCNNKVDEKGDEFCQECYQKMAKERLDEERHPDDPMKGSS